MHQFKNSFVKFSSKLQAGVQTIGRIVVHANMPVEFLQKLVREPQMKEVVLICFDLNNQNGCFKYDGKELSKFVSSNEYHYQARLGHYQKKLITVGSTTNSQSYGYHHSFAILYEFETSLKR